MARIKIDFGKKSIPWQIEKARDIYKRMSGNLNYPAPSPSLPVVKNAIDALEQSFIEAINFDREKKRVMRIRRRELHALIVALSDYVQQASGGDEEKILSSGFGVRKERMAAVAPNAPAWIKVNHTNSESEIELRWQAVSSAKAYIVLITDGSELFEGLLQKETSMKANLKISGLNSNTRYWLRVMAINSAGKSGWSDPVRGRTM